MAPTQRTFLDGFAEVGVHYLRRIPLLVQFAQQRQLLMMAQEAALKDVADGKMRRLLAYNKSFSCADFAIGVSALFLEDGEPQEHASLLGAGENLGY